MKKPEPGSEAFDASSLYAEEPPLKYDEGKPRFDLIDPNWELEVAKGVTHGAEKYSAYNWQNLPKEKIIAALRRHINAVERGELIDADSGLDHTTLASCELMFLHWKYQHEEIKYDCS